MAIASGDLLLVSKAARSIRFAASNEALRPMGRDLRNADAVSAHRRTVRT